MGTISTGSKDTPIMVMISCPTIIPAYDILIEIYQKKQRKTDAYLSKLAEPHIPTNFFDITQGPMIDERYEIPIEDIEAYLEIANNPMMWESLDGRLIGPQIPKRYEEPEHKHQWCDIR